MGKESVASQSLMQAEATLIVGKERIACYVVDVTAEEICVAVPGVQRYEGDSRMTLDTGDAKYGVRLVLQEAHAGGYSYRLRFLEPGEMPLRSGLFSTLLTRQTAWNCVAASLPLTILGLYCFLSSGDSQFSLMSRRSMGSDAGNASVVESDKDRVHQGTSEDEALTANNSGRSTKRNAKRADVEEPATEMKTMSVSLLSSASEPETPHKSVAAEQAAKRKGATLAAMLEAGRVGRSRSLTAELIPWLCGTNSANQLSYLKISDAACNDLQQFEAGLQGLSHETTTNAINSLRQTLKRSGNVSHAKTVHGFDDMFAVTSEDAAVYFRSRKGRVEIVRVLPIDLN